MTMADKAPMAAIVGPKETNRPPETAMARAKASCQRRVRCSGVASGCCTVTAGEDWVIA